MPLVTVVAAKPGVATLLRQAGTRPAASAVSAAAPSEKSRTGASSRIASRRGTPAGCQRFSSATTSNAKRSPAIIPAAARRPASSSDSAASRACDAPSAARIAASRSFDTCRASSRLRRFAQPITSTSATAAKSTSSAGSIGPTIWSRRRIARACMPASPAPAPSVGAAAATSLVAPAISAPGARRASMRKPQHRGLIARARPAAIHASVLLEGNWNSGPATPATV